MAIFSGKSGVGYAKFKESDMVAGLLYAMERVPGAVDSKMAANLLRGPFIGGLIAGGHEAEQTDYMVMTHLYNIGAKDVYKYLVGQK